MSKYIIAFIIVFASLFAFSRYRQINTVMYIGNGDSDLMFTETCQSATPYTFRVTVPCGENMYRRASYRCNKPGISLGTDQQSMGDSKSCQSLDDWYRLASEQCRGNSCPPTTPTPTSTPSPIPPIKRSCPPMPRCQPSQEMVTGEQIGGVGCPSYKCIYKQD